MRHILKISFLLLVNILCLVTAVSAQSTDLTVSELFLRYRRSAPDSNRVRLLLRIDSLYLYKMPDSLRILDSAIMLAGQAAQLSLQVGFKEGHVDAMFLLANAYAEKNDFAEAIRIANSSTDTQRIHMYIMIAERYVFKPGELPENLAKAYPFILAAIKLSEKQNFSVWHDKAVCILGKYYFAKGDFKRGKECFEQLIRKYHQTGNFSMEANWWGELGRYLPDRHSTYKEKVASFNKSLEIYRMLKDNGNTSVILESQAHINQLHGDLSKAESNLLESLRLRTSIGKKNIFELLSALAHINNVKGNYNKTLYYALSAVNNVDSIGEKYMSGVIYAQLADVYRSLGNTDKSLYWYTRAMDNLIGYRIQYRYPVCGRIVQALIKKGKEKQALFYLARFYKDNPTPRLVDKEIISFCFAECYRAMKKYRLAEQFYNEMISYDLKVREHFNAQVSVDGIENMVTGAEAQFSIGSFYVERKDYKIAEGYLLSSLSDTQYPPSLSMKKDIHLMLFRTDSAQGRLYSAIRHFEKHKTLNDSLFSMEKVKQIEELLIKYEIAKKEKDISALRAREQLQVKELQKSGQAKRFTYILICILFILMGLGFSRYKLKQKSNMLLQLKQDEINKANEILKHILEEKDILIGEKDILLEEKAWLLKELHHRVKNNLQVVISLLNTQSKFLESREAKNAIKESTHRMQAMSMIHQKLYHSEDTTMVNMQTYISELAEYLKSSFSENGRFFLMELEVDSVLLDIAQALPIGLILNEIITNAFKYAFPENEKGRILISMKKNRNSYVVLEVSDNGVGFPEGMSLETNDSMGIRLIKGLARQIGEELVIKSGKGVLFRINFKMADKKNFRTDLNEGISL